MEIDVEKNTRTKKNLRSYNVGNEETLWKTDGSRHRICMMVSNNGTFQKMPGRDWSGERGQVRETSISYV